VKRSGTSRKTKKKRSHLTKEALKKGRSSSLLRATREKSKKVIAGKRRVVTVGKRKVVPRGGIGESKRKAGKKFGKAA